MTTSEKPMTDLQLAIALENAIEKFKDARAIGGNISEAIELIESVRNLLRARVKLAALN